MRVAFQVHGRVQGVGYRYFAQQHGRILGLAGWVRNAFDGTVEGVVEGEDITLQAFRDALSRGPHSARVSRLDWQEAPAGESLPFPYTVRA